MFLIMLLVSFISIYAGLLIPQRTNGTIHPSLSTMKSNLYPATSWNPTETLAFLFPCFLGLWTGTNLAQRLRDPFKSIPVGGFSAIAISTGMYILFFTIIACVADSKVLREDFMFVVRRAWPVQGLAVVGVLTVGVGSAMQCLVAASRIVQCLGGEEVIPGLRRLGIEIVSEGGVARRAVLFVGFLAGVTVFVRDLEVLAGLVSMFFLVRRVSSVFHELCVFA